MCRNNYTILPDLLYNMALFFLAGLQVLAQEFGVGDSFDVEMNVANLSGRLGVILLLIVFLEKVIM